jgi:hypothetical protein
VLVPTTCHVESSAFARMHGLIVKPSDTNVQLGTGDSVPAQGECSVHIKLGDYQDRVECYVLDMVTDFQMILGDMWLNMVKATFDYDTRKCVIQKNNKRFALSSSTCSMLRHKLTSRGKKGAAYSVCYAGETSAQERQSSDDGSTQ